MVALAVAGRAGWRASDLELRHDAPSYTSATLDAVPRARLRAVAAVLHHRRRRVRRNRDLAATIRPSSTRALRRRLAAGLPGRASCRSGCRACADRMVRPPLDAIAQIDPSIISDRRADRRRVIHCDPRSAARSGESIAGLVPPAVQQHIEQHGLYTSTTPGRRGDRRARDAGGRQVAWPRLSKRRKTDAASASRSSARFAPPRTRRRRPRRARPAEGGRLHRLLRDLLGQQRAAGPRDRRRGRWRRSAADGVKPAHVEGYDRSEWILLDYFDFIVHVFAPETRAVLRPRAALGQRRAHRDPAAIDVQAARRSLRARLCDRSPTPSSPSSSRPPAPPATSRSNIRPAGRSATPAGASILPLTPPLCDAAAIRCRRGASSACRWRGARAAGARRRLDRPRARRSAPTTARCARSSTR